MAGVPSFLALDKYMEPDKDGLNTVDPALMAGILTPKQSGIPGFDPTMPDYSDYAKNDAIGKKFALSAAPVPGVAAPSSALDFMKFLVPTPEERALKNKYSSKTEEALNLQSAGISKLDQLMADLKARPTDLDLSPLAAYIDSTVPGSKLHATAEEMAKWNPTAKQAATIALQKDIQNATKGVSEEYLKNLGEQLKGLQSNRLAMGTAAALGKSEAFTTRNKLTMDAQAKAEEKNWDEDKINMPRLKQLGQIQLDRHTLEAGGVINETVMNEIANGIGNALAGGKAAGLGQAERNDLQSYAKKWAKIKGEIADKQFNALSDDNRKFLMNLFDRLENGFGQMIRTRAKEKRIGGTMWPDNPEAARVHNAKADFYENYGLDKEASPAASIPAPVSATPGELHDGMTVEELKKYIEENGG